MKKLVVLLFCLLAVPVLASHIVGGEFELIHVSGNRYRLNLILYFDKINGQPGAKDVSATVRIYRKGDDAFMGSLILTLSDESNVGYTQPECSHGELITSKLIYTSLLTLSDSQFGDARGYYVVWERCCRNYGISNIFSDSPDRPGAIYAGQTFYLEFPPVVKNGKPFFNSSPRLFPPLNDYACPNHPYFVDFAGIDDDGDSLVYSLVNPLNTHSNEAFPVIGPQPYPEVRWRTGFDVDRMMRGNPDLKISYGGMLTVTPKLQGLFVFAVKVDQYRNREKIGESRRDFQMLVVDACPHADPPHITGKKIADNTYAYTDNMTVNFSNAVTDEERCINIRITDADAGKLEDNFTERITLKVIGLNFNLKGKSNSLGEITTSGTSGTITKDGTLDMSVCFPACPYLSGAPYQVGIIAFDDACSLPLSDTLKVTVTVQPPPNTAPYFTTPVFTSQTLREGAKDEWPFEIRDDEQDPIVVSLITNGFLLANAGMTFTILSQEDGLVKGKITWDAFCSVYDFNKRTNFEIKLLAEDSDHCEQTDPVTSLYRLAVQLPGNADPLIYTDLGSERQARTVLGVQRKINERLSFHVFGSDATDHDYLVLDLLDKKTYSNLSLSFPTAAGNTAVQSQFLWDIKCDGLDLAKQDVYTFRFVVVDNANLCRLYKADTLDVQVKISPPDNAKPSLIVKNLNSELTLADNHIDITLGEQVILGIQGYDADLLPQKDALTLDLLEATGNVKPEGYTFSALKGQSPMNTTFAWNPGCDIFQDGVYENDYTFTFRLADNNCYAVKADTVAVTIRINDVNGSDEKFTPVNFFSPNDDGVNDYYSMEDLNKDTGEIGNMLPLDNCTGSFEAVRVYNRWGKQVFTTTDRNFRWYAKGEAAGVYYYVIVYTNREYKGALTIRY